MLDICSRTLVPLLLPYFPAYEICFGKLEREHVSTHGNLRWRDRDDCYHLLPVSAGTIPKELGALNKLKILSLAANGLSGERLGLQNESSRTLVLPADF